MQSLLESGIINTVEKEVTTTNPSVSPIRHPVTQEQIDDVLNNELKDYSFPVKPVYNSRIRDNGRTIGEFYRWGQLKQIKTIDIGKQDRPDRKFLVDTLLHEYYESEIMTKQFSEEFYTKLSKISDEKRHEWIDTQIAEFFKRWACNELGRC